MHKRPKPPIKIWFSLYAFAATIPVSIAGFLQVGLTTEMELTLREIDFYLLDLAITILVLLLILRRKNWARIVYTLLTAVALAGVFLERERIFFQGTFTALLVSLQVSLRLLSLYYLFVKESSEWFKTTHLEASGAQPMPHESMVSSNAFAHNNDDSKTHASRPARNSSNIETRATEGAWLQSKQKKVIVLTGGLVFCLCLVVVCIYLGHRGKTMRSIRSALLADVSLNKKIFGGRSIANCDAKTIQTYAQGLRDIDMVDCPRDFQVAYLDHVHAWESLARSRGSVDPVGAVIKFLVTKSLPSSPDEQPIHDEITRTWDKVERIALSYGVRMPE